MKRMLLYTLAVFGGLVLSTGCLDRSYVGEFDLITPIPLTLHLGENSLVMKGDGPVTSLERFNDSTMRVYAIRDDIPLPFSDPSAFVANGLPARVNVFDAKLDWLGKTPYYPTRERAHESYSIFASHYSDAAVKGDIIYEEDRISVPLRIDGSQDLIVGKARTADNGRDEVLESFSHYSSVSGITPVMYPGHALVCLSFKARTPNEVIYPIRICIDELTFKAKSDVIFTMAAKDPSQLGAAAYGEDMVYSIPLPDRESEKAIVIQSPPEGQEAQIVRLNPDPTDSRYDSFGLMIPASDLTSIYADLKIREYVYDSWTDQWTPLMTADGKSQVITASCQVKFPGLLKPGYRYDIILTINGMDIVGTRVKLVPWDFGGLIWIEQDEKPEFMN